MKHFFVFNKQFLFDKYLKERILNLNSTYTWNVFKNKNTKSYLLHDLQLNSYVFYTDIHLFGDESLEIYDLESPLDSDSFNLIAIFAGLTVQNDIRLYIEQAYGDDFMLSMISLGSCSGSSIYNLLQNDFKLFEYKNDQLSSNFIIEPIEVMQDADV